MDEYLRTLIMNCNGFFPVEVLKFFFQYVVRKRGFAIWLYRITKTRVTTQNQAGCSGIRACNLYEFMSIYVSKSEALFISSAMIRLEVTTNRKSECRLKTKILSYSRHMWEQA